MRENDPFRASYINPYHEATQTVTLPTNQPCPCKRQHRLHWRKEHLTIVDGEWWSAACWFEVQQLNEARGRGFLDEVLLSRPLHEVEQEREYLQKNLDSSVRACKVAVANTNYWKNRFMESAEHKSTCEKIIEAQSGRLYKAECTCGHAKLFKTAQIQ